MFQDSFVDGEDWGTQLWIYLYMKGGKVECGSKNEKNVYKAHFFCSFNLIFS